MGDEIIGDRRRRLAWPRRAAVPAAMACIALLAACSGGTSSSPRGSTQYGRALAYSQCMRSHGLPDFPDPSSDGTIVYNNGGRSSNGINTAYQTADNDCRHLQTSGSQMSGTQQQQALSQLVRYASCMRSHGVPNFPDPTASNGGMGFNLNGINLHSPQYQSANHACQSLQRKGQLSAGGQS